MKGRKDFKNIDLDNNKFSGDQMTELFQVLPLTKLNLIKSVLTEQQMKPLSQTMKANKNLQQIYMSHNQLSDLSLGMLAEGLSQIESLTELFLTHNDLSLSNGIKVLQSLSNKKLLKSLALNSCKLSYPLLDALLQSL